MNTMAHKGYTARVEFDERDAIFVGRFLGIADVIGFHSATVAALGAAFKEAVTDYLATWLPGYLRADWQARQRQHDAACAAPGSPASADRRTGARAKPQPVGH